MKTLKRLYEETFDLDDGVYERANRVLSSNPSLYCARYVEFKHAAGKSVVALCVEFGMFPSKSEALRKLKDGAIRVGRTAMATPLRGCRKLIADEPCNRGMMIRCGRRALLLIPTRPTLLEEVQYQAEALLERISPALWDRLRRPA